MHFQLNLAPPAFQAWLLALCGAVACAESPSHVSDSPLSASKAQRICLQLEIQTGFPGDSVVKNLPAKQETQIGSLGWEDPLEKEMASHSSVLAWEIPWTEELGGLESIGLQRIGHD